VVFVQVGHWRGAAVRASPAAPGLTGTYGTAETAPIGIRISQGKVNDYLRKWEGEEQDAEVIFGSLPDAGVDFLHVTDFQAWRPAFAKGNAPVAFVAKRIAAAVPLIVNGSLHVLGRAEQSLGQGADMVAFGRGALANPDPPRRMRDGQPLREFDASISDLS
jgi:2,4-dienoyl-CoA reductase-like NADH-dependent reductase (Old Yellow Enzyme family)